MSSMDSQSIVLINTIHSASAVSCMAWMTFSDFESLKIIFLMGRRVPYIIAVDNLATSVSLMLYPSVDANSENSALSGAYDEWKRPTFSPFSLLTHQSTHLQTL